MEIVSTMEAVEITPRLQPEQDQSEAREDLNEVGVDRNVTSPESRSPVVVNPTTPKAELTPNIAASPYRNKNSPPESYFTPLTSQCDLSKVRNALTELNSAVREEEEQFFAQLETVESQNQKLSKSLATMEELQESNEILKNSLEEARNLIQTLRMEAETQVKGLSNSLASRDAEISNFQEKFKTLSDTLSAKETELAAIQAEFKPLQEIQAEHKNCLESLTAKESELEQVKEDYNTTLESVETMTAELSKVRQECKTLQAELDFKEKELKDIYNKNNENTQSLKDKEAELEELKAQYGLSTDSFTAKNAELERIRADCDSLLQNLNGRESELVSLRSAYEQRSAAFKEADDELTALRESFTALQDEFDTVKAEKEAIESGHEEAKEKWKRLVITMKTEYDNFRASFDQLKASKKEIEEHYRADKEAYESEVSELRSKNGSLTASYDSLKICKEVSDEEYREFKATLEEKEKLLKEENQTLRSDLDALQVAKEECDRELNDFKKNLDVKVQETMAESEEKLTKVESDCVSLRSEINSLRLGREVVEQENEELKGRVENLSQERDGLEEALEAGEAELASLKQKFENMLVENENKIKNLSEEFEDKVAYMQTLKEEMEETIKTLRADKEAQTEAFENLKEEHETVVKEKEEISLQIERLQSEHATAIAEIEESHQASIAALEREKSELEESHKEIKGDLEKKVEVLKFEYDTLKITYRSLDEKLADTKNLHFEESQKMMKKIEKLGKTVDTKSEALSLGLKKYLTELKAKEKLQKEVKSVKDELAFKIEEAADLDRKMVDLEAKYASDMDEAHKNLEEAKQKHKEAEEQHKTNVEEITKKHAEVEATYLRDLQDLEQRFNEKEAKQVEERKQELGDMKSKHAAEVEDIKAKHTAQLDDIKAKYVTEAEDAKARHNAEMETLKNMSALILEEVKTSKTEELSVAKTKHQQELQGTIYAHSKEREEMVQKFSAELEEVKTKYAAELDETRTNYSNELEETKAKHAEELERANTKFTFDLEAAEKKFLGELEGSEKRVAALEDVIKYKDDEHEKLRRAQLASEDKVTEMEKLLAKTEAEILATKCQLDTQRESLEKAQSERDAIAADKAAISQTLEDAQSSLNEIKAECDELKSRLAELTKAKEHAEHNLEVETKVMADQFDAEKEANKKEVKFLSASVAKKIATITSLESKIAQLENSVEISKTSEKDAAHKMDYLSHLVESKEKELELLKSRCQSLQSSLNLNEDELGKKGSLEAQLHAANEKVAEATMLIDKKNKELQAINDRCDSLQTALKKAEAIYSEGVATIRSETEKKQRLALEEALDRAYVLNQMLSKKEAELQSMQELCDHLRESGGQDITPEAAEKKQFAEAKRREEVEALNKKIKFLDDMVSNKDSELELVKSHCEALQKSLQKSQETHEKQLNLLKQAANKESLDAHEEAERKLQALKKEIALKQAKLKSLDNGDKPELEIILDSSEQNQALQDEVNVLRAQLQSASTNASSGVADAELEARCYELEQSLSQMKGMYEAECERRKEAEQVFLTIKQNPTDDAHSRRSYDEGSIPEDHAVPNVGGTNRGVRSFFGRSRGNPEQSGNYSKHKSSSNRWLSMRGRKNRSDEQRDEGEGDGKRHEWRSTPPLSPRRGGYHFDDKSEWRSARRRELGITSPQAYGYTSSPRSVGGGYASRSTGYGPRYAGAGTSRSVGGATGRVLSGNTPEDIMSQIPNHIKNNFLEVGFYKQRLQNRYLPVLCLGPFDVPPGPIRDDWMSKFNGESKVLNLGVYFYGKDGSDEDAYGTVPWFAFVPYDKAVSRGMTETPKEILDKVDEGVELTPDEKQIYKGLEEVREAAEKSKEERGHPLQVAKTKEQIEAEKNKPIPTAVIAASASEEEDNISEIDVRC